MVPKFVPKMGNPERDSFGGKFAPLHKTQKCAAPTGVRRRWYWHVVDVREVDQTNEERTQERAPAVCFGSEGWQGNLAYLLPAYRSC